MDEKNRILAKQYIIIKIIAIIILAIIVIIGIMWEGKSANKNRSVSDSAANLSDKHE